MKKLFWIVSVICCSSARAQINFQFVPELHGRTADGLFQVKILNAANSIFFADLTISVTAKGSGEVVKIVSNNISINPGLNTLSPLIASNSLIQFSVSELSRIIKQSNFFPEAEYEYCFKLEERKNSLNLLGQECFDYYMEPFSPLSLIEPYNTLEMCDKKPVFIWQPIFPSITGLQYQLILAEVKEKQSPTEALFYNIPIINLKNLSSSFLPYPSVAKNLDSAKKYVWQVTAYRGNMILSRSEVWTFKITCEKEVITNPNDGYRNIEDLLTGNYYIANERILFSMNNSYTEKEMEYSIVCLTDPEIKMRKLAKIKLMRGRNNITIPLDNKRMYKEGYSYIMKVKLPNGTDKTLRFIYKKN